MTNNCLSPIEEDFLQVLENLMGDIEPYLFLAFFLVTFVAGTSSSTLDWRIAILDWVKANPPSSITLSTHLNFLAVGQEKTKAVFRAEVKKKLLSRSLDRKSSFQCHYEKLILSPKAHLKEACKLLGHTVSLMHSVALSIPVTHAPVGCALSVTERRMSG